MTTQIQPYEILLRFKDGVLSGAHYVEITRYLEADGSLITEKTGQAQPLPTELSETILGKINAGAVAKIAELEAAEKKATEDHAAATKKASEDHAAALQEANNESAALKKEAADSTAALAEKLAYQNEMVGKVTSALQSGDPAEFEKLAIEFLTPAQEKARAEKLTQLAALKAELGITD